MTVLGDGFLPYHFDIYVEAGCSEEAKEEIKNWQAEFRLNGTWIGFPQTMIEKLEALPGVIRVEEEGPQSAVLIPLRMIHGITGYPCVMSTVLGEGEVSRAIGAKCDDWGIELRPSRIIEGSDSPIEVSIREPDGISDSVRIYPSSRRSYNSTLRNISQTPEHLIVTRCNKGIAALAKSVSDRHGVVSMRIRDFGRYDNVENYVELLPLTSHLILSSRNNVLREFSRSIGTKLSGRWPTGLVDLKSESGLRFANWLLERMPQNGTVVFTLESTHETVFFRNGCEPIGLVPKETTSSVSRVARLQGALLGAELLSMVEQEKYLGRKDWERYYRYVMEYSFNGTQQHPWIYPEVSVSQIYGVN